MRTISHSSARSTASFRSLVFAGLALAGTVASFGATTTPAYAASQQTYYTAKLQAPLASPQKLIARGVVWSCAGDTCVAPRSTSRPVNVCARLAKEVGSVTQFATSEGEIAAEDLTRCNAG